jgi:hypothetical protein
MESLALVREELAYAVALGARTLDQPEVLQFEEFDQKLRTLASTCREAFQRSLRGDAEAIARKLEEGQALDADERNTLEMLFAGEAKHYLNAENNFDEWIAELRRLVAELDACSGQSLSIPDVMHVQALCREAMHLLPEVLYHLRETERLRTIRGNLQGEIGPRDAQNLARMIRDLMASPHR